MEHCLKNLQSRLVLFHHHLQLIINGSEREEAACSYTFWWMNFIQGWIDQEWELPICLGLYLPSVAVYCLRDNPGNLWYIDRRVKNSHDDIWIVSWDIDEKYIDTWKFTWHVYKGWYMRIVWESLTKSWQWLSPQISGSKPCDNFSSFVLSISSVLITLYWSWAEINGIRLRWWWWITLLVEYH